MALPKPPDRGERPPDSIEPLLEPFSATTKRWLAILGAVSALALVLAVSGSRQTKIAFGGFEIGPLDSGKLHLLAGSAAFLLSAVALASAGADMVSVHERWRRLRIRNDEWEGRDKPTEERRLRSVLLEPSIRPILASRLGIPLLVALVAAAFAFWS